MTRSRVIASCCLAAALSSLALAQSGAISRREPAVRPSDDRLRHFEHALSALERGDARSAQAIFALLLKTDFPAHWTRTGLASCALLNQDYDIAAADFESLTRSEAAPPVARLGFGCALLNQGKIPQALAQLQQAARDSPSSSARFMLAAALALSGEGERAAQEIERGLGAMTNGPASSLPDEVRGLAAILSGEPQKAIEHFRRVLAEPIVTGRAPLTIADAAIARKDSANSIARRPATGFIGRKSPGSFGKSEGASERREDGLIIRRKEDEGDNDEITDRALRGQAPLIAAFLGVNGVEFVVFSIDGRQRATVNKAPFRWDWDTTAEADGPHRVQVQALGADRSPLATVDRQVEVRNRVPPAAAGAAGARRHEAVETSYEQTYGARFERLLEFRPDLLRARYLLAQAYEAEGLADFAAEELALVFLQRPGYLDARKRFLALRAQLQPTYRARGLPEVRSVLRNDRVVGLTFDDGPRPFYTSRILELLHERNVRATFFVVGKMVDTYPQLARDILSGGHELANHSFEHDNMEKFSVVECEQDVLRCERAVFNATGQRPRLFRPPGGRYGPELKQALGNLGYSTIFWTSNITSWPDKPADEIALRIAEKVASGGILLLHNGQDQTVWVLPRLLDLLKQRGYRCVPISQLLERS